MLEIALPTVAYLLGARGLFGYLVWKDRLRVTTYYYVPADIFVNRFTFARDVQWGPFAEDIKYSPKGTQIARTTAAVFWPVIVAFKLSLIVLKIAILIPYKAITGGW